MKLRDAERTAEDATPKTVTCAVCGRTGQATRNGRRMRKHNRTILHREADEHGPAVETTTDCRGSRRPPVEFAKAFKAARSK